MRLRLRRMAAIVKADFLIRFRRLSTLIVFLLLSSFVYVWVPDPATGSALRYALNPGIKRLAAPPLMPRGVRRGLTLGGNEWEELGL